MEVKGTAVLAIKEYVKTNYAPDYNKWFDSLSDKSKAIYVGPIDATKWYPVEDGAIEPTVVLSKYFFNGDAHKGAWESGRYSAYKALTGIYKIFVKAASPTYIIQRASRVFATYYRPCEMKLASSKSHSCIVEISEMEQNLDIIEQRILGWIEQALEISGSKNVKLELKQKSENEVVKEIFISWE
jgi:hypothetical protein